MKFSKRDRDSVLRGDLHCFIERSFMELNPGTVFLPNWHLELIAHELELCRMGKTKRLIINMPPRSLKSHCISVAFPAWLLGQNPSAQIICASYAQDLADKHAIDCRALIESAFYQGLFPTRISRHKRAAAEFLTTGRGCRKATSVGGVLTGRGADFIIIDDPLQPDKALSDARRQGVNDWFDHTLSSRLNDKRHGCIILVMQRLHEDDLTGHLLRREQWRHIRLPAIAECQEEFEIESWFGRTTRTRKPGDALHPEREPLEILRQLRETQGEYTFAGQYQQSPSPLGGGMVKAKWFKTYTDQTRPSFDLIFQSWDTANKATELSDYSVCTTWGIGGNNLFLIDVLREKMEYPALKRAVRTHAMQYHVKNILIEDKASGTQLAQELIADGVRGITKWSSKLDKVMRLHAVTSVIENGFVYLPEASPWLSTYLHEMITFPNDKYDDQVDSTSQAIEWSQKRAYRSGIFQYYKQEAERIRSMPSPRFFRGPYDLF